MRGRFLVFLGLLALMGACGGEDEEPTLSREDFCSKWGRAACSEETVDACQAASVDACRAAQRAACLDVVGDDFIDNGADACLNSVERAYRDADLTSTELKLVLDLAGACSSILSGPGEEGDDCAVNADCDRVYDLECVIKGGADMGTCQIPEEIEAGRECSDPEDVCEAGFFCNDDNCIAQRGEGDDCARTEECEAELFCNPEAVCEARREIDSECTANEQCLSDVCFEFDDTVVCIDRLRLSRSEPICEAMR